MRRWLEEHSDQIAGTHGCLFMLAIILGAIFDPEMKHPASAIAVGILLGPLVIWAIWAGIEYLLKAWARPS